MRFFKTAVAMAGAWLVWAPAALAQQNDGLCERVKTWATQTPARDLPTARAEVSAGERRLVPLADRAIELHQRRLALSRSFEQRHADWFQVAATCRSNPRFSPACRQAPPRIARDQYMAAVQGLETELGVAVYEFYAEALESAARMGTTLFLRELGDREDYNPRQTYDIALQRQIERLGVLRTGEFYLFGRQGLSRERATEAYDGINGDNQRTAETALACSRRAHIDANWDRVLLAMHNAEQTGFGPGGVRLESDAAETRLLELTRTFLPPPGSAWASASIDAERRRTLEAPLQRARTARLLAQDARERAEYQVAAEQEGRRVAAVREAVAASMRPAMTRLGIRAGVNSLPDGDIRASRDLIPCASAAFPFRNGRIRHFEIVEPGRQPNDPATAALMMMALVHQVTADGKVISTKIFYPTHHHRIERFGECDYMVRHERTIQNTSTAFGDGGGEIMRFHRMWNGAYVVARESLASGQVHYQLMRPGQDGHWEFVNLPCSGMTGLISQFTGMRMQDGRCHADTLTILVTNLSLRTNDRITPTNYWKQ